MHTVSKGVLKAKMLEYFRQVENTQEELIVTDHNRPVLRILPFQERKLPTDVFGAKCKVTYYEDINTSTESEWDEV
jgi:prevent-host-death family protein